MTFLFSILVLALLLAGGMHVAFALGVTGAIGLYLQNGFPAMMGILEITPYRTVANFLMTTVPMFILMAEFASEGKLTQKLYFAANKWLGHLPGGLAIATVMGSAGFAAVSGSSTASAATFSSVAMPEMKKYGYRAGFAAGVIGTSGTLAIMIPPSVGFILYGVITEVSIGKLFIAGIIPGILTALSYCLTIFLRVKITPDIAPTISPSTLKEKINSLKPTWPVFFLAALVLGGIYSGAITATEAGAVGASGALLISLFVGKMNVRGIWVSLARTARTCSMIFAIIIGAMIFGYFATSTQLTQNMIMLITDANLSPNIVLTLSLFLFLLLGCMLDQIAILLITIPLLFPLIINLGFDPIWFGVVMVKTAEIGMVTPPIGMNIFVTSAASGVRLEEIFRGIWPFVAADMIILVLLCVFPQICLWLPNLMSN